MFRFLRFVRVQVFGSKVLGVYRRLLTKEAGHRKVCNQKVSLIETKSETKLDWAFSPVRCCLQRKALLEDSKLKLSAH